MTPIFGALLVATRRSGTQRDARPRPTLHADHGRVVERRAVYRYLVLISDAQESNATSDARQISERVAHEQPFWSKLVDEAGLAAFHADAGGLDATSRDQLTSCESRVLTGRRKGVV